MPIYNKIAGLEYGVALNDSWRVKPYSGISPLGLVISAVWEKFMDRAWQGEISVKEALTLMQPEMEKLFPQSLCQT